MDLSLVTDCGVNTHECGYCHTPDSWTNHGIWAFNLRNYDYLALLHRGWRRSGHYIYRPALKENCCVSYTIRLDTTQFKPTRSQKRCRRLFDRFLEGTWVPTEHRLTGGRHEQPTDEELQAAGLSRESHYPHPQAALQAEQVGRDEAQQLRSSQQSLPDAMSDAPTTATGITGSGSLSTTATTTATGMSMADTDVSYLSSATQTPRSAVAPPPVTSVPGSPLHKKVKSDTESPDRTHQSPPLKGTKHTFQVSMVPAEFRREAYEVYQKYQIAVHHDKPEDVSEKAYTRFLCDSPLTKNEKQGAQTLGSFHIEYRIDGKLMMVDVVDMLQNCLSSVYLFYDPAYSFLSPGVVSALFEIERVRALKDSTLRYIYLGYYIHTCPKMRYKAQFHPTEVMCPETYRWYPLDSVVAQLDKARYCRFAPPLLPGQPTDDEAERDYSDRIGTTPVAFKRTIMAFSQLPAAKRNDPALRRAVATFWQRAGPELATRLVLVMQ